MDTTTAGGEQEGDRGVFKEEDQTGVSTAPEKNQSHEDEPKSSSDMKEGEEGSVGGQEEEVSSSEMKELEDQKTSSAETQEQDPAKEAAETDGREEEKSEEATSSAR